MNQKIMSFLDAHESIDDDNVVYYPDLFPFSLEEFREFTSKLWEDAGGWAACGRYVVDYAMFETYKIPFQHEGRNYFLQVMYGQGSAWTVFTEKAYQEHQARIRDLHLKEDKENEAD